MRIRLKILSAGIAFFCVPLMLSGQTYSAMVLSLDGEGVVVRNAKEQRLEVPQRFAPGDMLSIRQGNAIIMLFTGEEIPLSAVSYYTIPESTNASGSEIAALANSEKADISLLARSGVAYQIRGTSRVFPRKSKLQDKEKAILRVNYGNPDSLNLSLKLIDSQTQKVIFQRDSIADSLISLAEAPFVEGRSYYWTLGNTPDGRPELGTIVVATAESVPLSEPLRSHFDYLNAISARYDTEYYFEAFDLIMQARDKFPEIGIYTLMKENMLAQ